MVPAFAPLPVLQQTAGAQGQHVANQALAPGFDVMGGLAVRIGSGDVRSDALRRWGAAVTIGAGTVSAFRMPSTAPTFRVNSELRNYYGLQQAITFIAFKQPPASPKLTWFAGLRLREFRFARRRSSELIAAPGRFDFEIGQNGLLRRSGAEFSFRVSGYYPLGTGRIARTIALRGRFETLLAQSETRPTFVATPADASSGPPEATFVAVLTGADRPRAAWNIGIGVEVVSLIRGR
jgi:hypothetical protein